jgi:hypothetical protein
MSLRFPVLNIGVTNESFNCAGKIPADSDLLKIMQSGVAKPTAHFFTIEGGILSGPDPLLTSKSLSTSSTLAIENCSDYFRSRIRWHPFVISIRTLNKFSEVLRSSLLMAVQRGFFQFNIFKKGFSIGFYRIFKVFTNMFIGVSRDKLVFLVVTCNSLYMK